MVIIKEQHFTQRIHWHRWAQSTKAAV